MHRYAAFGRGVLAEAIFREVAGPPLRTDTGHAPSTVPGQVGTELERDAHKDLAVMILTPATSPTCGRQQPRDHRPRGVRNLPISLYSSQAVALNV